MHACIHARSILIEMTKATCNDVLQIYTWHTVGRNGYQGRGLLAKWCDSWITTDMESEPETEFSEHCRRMAELSTDSDDGGWDHSMCIAARSNANGWPKEKQVAWTSNHSKYSVKRPIWMAWLTFSFSNQSRSACKPRQVVQADTTFRLPHNWTQVSLLPCLCSFYWGCEGEGGWKCWSLCSPEW